MMMTLDRAVKYRVVRQHSDTLNTRVGVVYDLVWDEISGWHCRHPGDVKNLYSSNERTFYNRKFWKILGEYPKQKKQEKETEMSFDKVKDEALEIEVGVTLVNGQKLDKFSDQQLVKMVAAERDKVRALEQDIGQGGKYVQVMAKRVEDNVRVLLDELDRRV